MTEMWKRIKHARKTAGLTQQSLADSFTPKLTRAAVALWESENPKVRTSPKKEQLKKISELSGFSVEYLLYGSDKIKSLSTTEEIKNGSAAARIQGRVPLLTWSQAGKWEEIVDNLQPLGSLPTAEITVPIGRHTFVTLVPGDSMADEFTDGDEIVIEPDMMPEHKDFVLAKFDNEDPLLRQLWKEGGEWMLKPKNERYPIKPLGTAYVIGVVRARTKRYR